VYRVRTNITGPAGAPWLSTMYFDVVGGLTAANANAAVGTFWTAIRAHIATGTSIATEAEVGDIDIATGELTGLFPVTPVVTTGSGATDALPFATQGLLRWRTGVFVGGREVRGRTFLPAPIEGDSVVGIPSATYISNINSAAATLLGSAVADLMIYSKKNRDAVPALSGSVWNKWAVLRSRRD